jgi:hypothetical protein
MGSSYFLATVSARASLARFTAKQLYQAFDKLAPARTVQNAGTTSPID